MQISTQLNDARLAGVLAFLATGTTNAKVQIFSGTQPAFGADLGNPALVEIFINEPAGTVSGGVLTLTTTQEYIIAQSGVATWARVLNGDGVLAFDCAVTDDAGAGPIKLSQTTLYAGGFVRLTGGTLA